MNKFLALMISMMCVLGLVACGGSADAEVETKSDLVAAKEYLYTMYKDGNPVTPTDYTVVGVVNIGGVAFDVEWTADSDTVKFAAADKMVTVDVDEMNPEEVVYNLTATLTDAEGNTESVSFQRSVPAAIIIEAGMSYEELVDLAYTLADGSIVAFNKAAKACELPIGTQLTDTVISTGVLKDCTGFIDVNGVTLPNKEVSCGTGATNTATQKVQTPCTVKNDANHMTDVFPIVFHDATVEPASDAAKYVLTSSK